MALKANYEFLFVGRDENSFLENYSYDLFQEHGDKSGEVFINLEIQNNQVDAEEIGALIFETMQKAFFENVEKEAYERFESALKDVNNVLADFKKQKFSGYIGNLNVIIAAIVDDVLYLSQAGDAEAYLVRKRYVSVVSEGLSEDSANSEEVFSSIASGKIEVGDFVLFASTRLLRYIPKNELARCVGKNDVAEALNDVRDVISTEVLGRVSLTAMIFEKPGRDDVEATLADVDVAAKSVIQSSEGESSVYRESVSRRFSAGINGKRMAVSFWHKLVDGLRFFHGSIKSKGFGKDKILALLIILIVVLTIGIWFAKGNQAENEEIKRLDVVLQEVQTRLADANTKGAYDKDGAKILLDKSYDDAMSVLNSGYYRDKAKLYLVQIEEARDKLDNVQRVDTSKPYVDLITKRPDINALGFVQLNGRKFVFEYNALYELVLDQVQDPLTIDDTETVVAATGFDDRNSIVFMTKNGKLMEYRDGTVSFMDSEEGGFHRGVALADWSNKVYILSPVDNQIWRYTFKGAREQFGQAEGYIADTNGLDLSKAQDLAIDSNVYILENTGDLKKFYAGKKADFYVNNPPFNSLKDPKVVYTDEKLGDLYVLDAKGARVLVYSKDDKTGNVTYKSQFLFDNVGELRDLYVDSEAQKMYVLSASKVFEVNL